MYFQRCCGWPDTFHGPMLPVSPYLEASPPLSVRFQYPKGLNRDSSLFSFLGVMCICFRMLEQATGSKKSINGGNVLLAEKARSLARRELVLLRLEFEIRPCDWSF